MAFIPIQDAWRVSLSGTTEVSTPWAMVFCVHDTGAHDVPSANGIEVAFHDWFQTSLAPLVLSSTELNLIRLLDLNLATGISLNYPVSPAVPGTLSGQPAGSQVAVMVTLASDSRGRANRGRKYVPGVGTSHIDATGGTSLEPISAQAFTDAFVALQTALKTLGGGKDLAVESKRQQKAVIVTKISGRLHLGGQRRRRNNKV